MVDVLEELTAETLSREYVERRLEDWLRRVEDLFTSITSWAGPDWSPLAPRRTVLMIEEPMREVGLDPIKLPVLDLLKEGKPSVAVEPRSLWIIGANGRLDVVHRGSGAPGYFLIDQAENLEPPKWRVVSFANRVERRPLDKATLLSIL